MNIGTKLTLYDFLCMMVTGFLILFPFCHFLAENEWGATMFFSILCYLVGLVYHKFAEFVMKPSRLIPCMVEKGRKNATNSFCRKTGKERPDEKRDYYEAYYYLMRKNSLNVIPVLEAQATFIRNLYPILIIYIFCLAANCSSLNWLDSYRCQVIVLLAILVVSLPFVWYSIQTKVYEAVWEGDLFIRDSIQIKENETGTN